MTQIMLRPKSRNSRRKTGLILGLLTSLAAAVGGIYYIGFAPNSHHTQPDYHGIDKPIYHRGTLLDTSAIGTKESLKLPLPVVQQYIDETLHYEEATESIILTTKGRVVRLKTDQLTAMMNAKPYTLRFPVEKVKDTIYVPIAPLQEIYNLQVKEDAKTGIVTLLPAGDVIQWGKMGRTTAVDSDEVYALRTTPSKKAPILADLRQGDAVVILGEEDGWYRLQIESGVVGYSKKTDVVWDHPETIASSEPSKVFVPWKPLGGKINAIWEQVSTKTPSMDNMTKMPGLNVVSPTWFELASENGSLINRADSSYVQWAHAHDLQVWALFSNGFDPDLTTKALSTYDRRLAMIQQLLTFTQVYHLQGINIDFENVYTKDKRLVTQFVRELTPLLHEQGLTVSMDVTPISNSEMWSLFYDREALGKVIDYMMVMTYDEHWATSPTSGSVASLPWVEKSIVRIMEESQVPASKIILGLPFYARLWSEKMVDGKVKVTSKALSMSKMKAIISDKKLKPEFSEETGQHYIEYKEGDTTFKAWIENATSVKARMELVQKYDLAGSAAWRRGFETEDIWTTIVDTLTKKP